MSIDKRTESALQGALPEDIDWEPFPALSAARSSRRRCRPPDRARSLCGSGQGPSGVKLMPHVHHEDRVYTVMSGVFYIGVGEGVRRGEAEGLPPGAVIVLPGGNPHFHWAKSGEYVTQVTAIGPISLDYVNPQDDPRRKQTTSR